MQEISIKISGSKTTQPEAQQIAQIIAQRDNPETICISRFNRPANACSPCCLKQKIGNKPGWEVYGENHGGRLKVTVNEGDYIFIFS
jgi:hypothetical protein